MGNNIQTPLKYSIETGDQQLQGETPIYRHPNSQNNISKIPRSGIKNLQEMIQNSVQQFGGKECLGSRSGPNKQYSHKSYQEVFQLSQQIGSGIINFNLIPDIKKYEEIDLKLVGIHAQNREEWIVLDIANMLYGNTMVPLYDTLGPDTIKYVINHSEITTLFCQALTIKSTLKCEDIPNLKNIVVFDEISEETIELIQKKGLKLYKWEEILESGKQSLQKLPEIPENCCFTFSYTSGTTGQPKGAMISHSNLISILSSMETLTPVVDHTDVHLSYLPLPHLYERTGMVFYLSEGVSICFYGGDLLKLKEDLADVRPTFFTSVPRVYNKFYSAMKAKFEEATGLKKILLNQALNSKLYYLENQGAVTHKLWDNIIFNKTKALLGGRCRMMISGSAPISKEVINFLKVTMACPFKEGYGMTESVTAGFFGLAEDITTGHVGGPINAVEIKLVDVPEMNYTSKDQDEQGNVQPRGEILMRGPSIFKGYYKDKQKTEETIDKEGWLHTGDIGLRLPSGAFKIIDRKKNIFKLAQGEYIAPEKIENIYVRAPEVEQAFIHGESLENFCIGIIHPNEQAFMDLAKKKQQQGTFQELCKNEVMIQAILDIVTQYGKEEKLYGFEQAKKVLLVHKNFSEYNCITNTMKLQRHKAKLSFQEDIKKIYQEKKQD